MYHVAGVGDDPGAAPVRSRSCAATCERTWSVLLFRLVCARMAGHLPSPQTERRGGAGPAGACLAVRTPPAALLFVCDPDFVAIPAEGGTISPSPHPCPTRLHSSAAPFASSRPPRP